MNGDEDDSWPFAWAKEEYLGNPCPMPWSLACSLVESMMKRSLPKMVVAMVAIARRLFATQDGAHID